MQEGCHGGLTGMLCLCGVLCIGTEGGREDGKKMEDGRKETWKERRRDQARYEDGGRIWMDGTRRRDRVTEVGTGRESATGGIR